MEMRSAQIYPALEWSYRSGPSWLTTGARCAQEKTNRPSDSGALLVPNCAWSASHLALVTLAVWLREHRLYMDTDRAADEGGTAECGPAQTRNDHSYGGRFVTSLARVRASSARVSVTERLLSRRSALPSWSPSHLALVVCCTSRNAGSSPRRPDHLSGPNWPSCPFASSDHSESDSNEWFVGIW
jgi:hypothetical protein